MILLIKYKYKAFLCLAGTNLNVLKAVEKRDNSNLIDLTPFDTEVDASSDKGVRVSLLEAFDPLLISADNAFPDDNGLLMAFFSFLTCNLKDSFSL